MAESRFVFLPRDQVILSKGFCSSTVLALQQTSRRCDKKGTIWSLWYADAGDADPPHQVLLAWSCSSTLAAVSDRLVVGLVGSGQGSWVSFFWGRPLRNKTGSERFVKLLA